MPGLHSRPVSKDDPDIAPLLTLLRETSDLDGANRPVNIQASRDIVIQFRGDLLDQPYSRRSKSRRRATFRLLTYNIWLGGQGRADKLARVIQACRPDPCCFRKRRGRCGRGDRTRVGDGEWRAAVRQSLG